MGFFGLFDSPAAHTRSKEKKAAEDAKANKPETRGMGQRSSQPAATTGAPSQVTSSPATAPIVPGASPDKRNKLLGRKRGRDSSAIPTTSSSSVPLAKPIQATRPASYFAQSQVDEQADDEPVAALPTPDPTTVTTAETTPFPDQRQEISPEEFLPDSQSLPSYATSAATKVLQRQLKQIIKIQLSTTSGNERYWTLDLSKLDDLYSWYFSLTTFDPDIPLSQDMRRLGVSSIQMQVLFGPQHPHTPPFVRIIKPRFKQWMHGGGGHVTAGGSICVEMLTMAGWKKEYTMEQVLLIVHQALSDTEPLPARLIGTYEYSVQEAVNAYLRVANSHGWRVPQNWHRLFTQN